VYNFESIEVAAYVRDHFLLKAPGTHTRKPLNYPLKLFICGGKLNVIDAIENLYTHLSNLSGKKRPTRDEEHHHNMPTKVHLSKTAQETTHESTEIPTNTNHSDVMYLDLIKRVHDFLSKKDLLDKENYVGITLTEKKVFPPCITSPIKTKLSLVFILKRKQRTYEITLLSNALA
jgi:hypothetical protein